MGGESKECYTCGVEKELDAFYKNARMKDGTINKCKECSRDSRRQHYRENIEYYRAYEKSRDTSSAKLKETRRKYRESSRGREVQRESVRRWEKANKIKADASNRVRTAVNEGRLVKPSSCSECGSCVGGHYLHGHHDDYSRPLDVRWLCHCCHSLWHKENGEARNALPSK